MGQAGISRCCQTNIFANFQGSPYFPRHADISRGEGAPVGRGSRMKELCRHQSGWVITFLAAVRNDWQSKLVLPRGSVREPLRRRRHRECTRSFLRETSSLTVSLPPSPTAASAFLRAFLPAPPSLPGLLFLFHLFCASSLFPVASPPAANSISSVHLGGSQRQRVLLVSLFLSHSLFS